MRSRTVRPDTSKRCRRFTRVCWSAAVGSDPEVLVRDLADVYRDLERPRESAAALTRLFKKAEPDTWPNELQLRDALEIALVFEETGAHDTALEVLTRAAKTGSGEGPMMVRKIAFAWLAGRGAEVETLER